MRGLRENRMCRLCLSTGCCLIDILEGSRNDEFVVKQAVEDLLQLVVLKEALYPWLVCSICLEKLREFHFFKQRCVESQEVYDCRIRGNSWPVNQVLSTECDNIPVKSEGNAIEDPLHYDAFKNMNSDHSNQPVAEDLRFDSKVAVKCEEDGSTWESMELDSHNPTDYNSFELTQSATGHDSDFDIPIKTEEENTFEDPLHQDACKNMDSDHSSQPSSEFLSIDSNVNVKSEEIEEDDVQEKGPFSIESDLSSKSNIGDVSIHGMEFESSGGEQDGAGSGVSDKGQEAISEQDAVSSMAPHTVVVEESVAVSNPASSSVGTNVSRRRTETARGGSDRGRSRDRDGNNSCFGRRKVREKFICVECGASFFSKLTLSTHIRAHHQGTAPRKTVSSHKSSRIFTKKSKEKREKTFICDSCGKVFLRKSHLFGHVNSVHLGLKPFHCNICSQSFSRKGNLKNHAIAVHTGERRFKCEECGWASKTASDLKTHMLTHLEKRPFPCTLCPRSFLLKHQLWCHMESHSGRDHTCEVCGKHFRETFLLQNHIRRHSQERFFKCEQCLKAFKTKVELTEHSRVHSRLRKYSCGLCGKKYTHSGNLSAHMRIHDGMRPYECQLCHKKFSQSGTLSSHMRTHNGVRPYECQLCHKKFTRSGHLKDHMRTHDGLRPYECQQCHKKFSQSGNLSSHMRIHDGVRPYECQLCHKKFSQSGNLKEHMDRHKERSHECQQCCKLFKTKSDLKSHVARHCSKKGIQV